jgi:hypothetical protein
MVGAESCSWSRPHCSVSLRDTATARQVPVSGCLSNTPLAQDDEPGDVGGGCGPPVAEGDADPPGPIPNPVVKRASAGGYCGFQRRGRRGRCGRTTPELPILFRFVFPFPCVAGWSSGSSSGS